ncbi:ankyrin repeat domain-containing 63-like [Brachionus plicatilis]|uniref:Ankyrin repeat domain-containing 63-like n=1 Tax=Brachionus plicatilis TaxID=10195 RepID=A0A3M7QV44_BRAPC|nr:ankyrin repeat domain-containing 63-like [Brachionus plicatilis]
MTSTRFNVSRLEIYELAHSAPSNRALKPKPSANAIHQSILDGRLRQVNYFIQMGVNVNSKDKYHRTCLMLACLSDHEEYGVQVAKLLLKSNADINIQDGRGRTAVFLACSQNREKLLDLFLDSYSPLIDYRLKDNDGNALINHVAVNGSVYALRKLVEKMNQKRVEVDHRNSLGYTALLLAIKNDKYLNAYYLIKDGLASTYLKDNEHGMNAIEWLFARINTNREKILNNDLESNSCLAFSRAQSSNPNYKTWYGTHNQYYLNEHCANLSADHSKSRYIPLILKNKTLNLDNIQPVRMRNEFLRFRSTESLSDKSSLVSSEYSEDLDESLSVKEIVQKLYELIFKRMSQSVKQSQGQVEKLEPDAKPKVQRRQSMTRQRSHSIKPNEFKMEEIREREEKKQEIKPEVKPDANIFDLEELRYTPRLIALTDRNNTSRSSKEIVQRMFGMYDLTSTVHADQTKVESKAGLDFDLPKLNQKGPKIQSTSTSAHVKFSK